MLRKVLIPIILYSLIASLIGVIACQIEVFRNYGFHLFWLAAGIGQLAGITLLLAESKIYNTKYFIFLFIGIIIFMVGLHFKILHWPYGNTILVFSILFIFITYGVRFLNKKQKNLLDFTKFLWILPAGAALIFRFSHWLYSDLLSYISSAIIWAGLIFILYKEYEKTIKEILVKRK